MKNIHLIPTDKPSRLYLGNNGNFVFGMIQTSIQSRNDDFTNQHLYITSDEKFNRDEYVTDGVEVIKATPKLVDAQSLVDRRDWKKIILTTDGDLIKDCVQAIDDEFLEWFVKNPSCEEIKVESWEPYADFNFDYKIIIPKQHVELINDNIEEFDKAIELFKQETLEQVAERLYPIKHQSYMEDYIDINYDERQGFIKGAKWQQERSYSEEEIKSIARDAYSVGRYSPLIGVFDKWFKQFKKK